jgi:ATP-dependent Zn protease
MPGNLSWMGMVAVSVLTRLWAPLVLAVATMTLAVGASTSVPSALAAASLTDESLAAFEGQITGHQVRTVSLVPSAHAFHVALRDGRKVRVAFPPTEQQRLVSRIESAGITVKVAKVKPAHSKKRYVIGGVVIALIVLAGGGWLLLRRKRMREEEEGPRASTLA